MVALAIKLTGACQLQPGLEVFGYCDHFVLTPLLRRRIRGYAQMPQLIAALRGNPLLQVCSAGRL